MESDRNLAAVTDNAELARRCRMAAENTGDSEIVTACRQLATHVARQASTLATDIRQGRATSRPVEPPPAPPEAAPRVTQRPTAPVQPEIEEAVPLPSQPELVEAFDSAVSTDVRSDTSIELVTIAQTEAAKEAVRSAIRLGRSLAVVGDGTFIDIHGNSIWTVTTGTPLSHAGAVDAARRCTHGNFRDWRLPDPEELESLLARGGLPGYTSSGPRFWTRLVRSRLLGIVKQAAVYDSQTGQTEYVSRRTAGVLAHFTRP
jgi:hypothetical protein